MIKPGDQGLAQLLAEYSASSAHRGLARTLAALKDKKPAAGFQKVWELSALTDDIALQLADAEKARDAGLANIAENGYARAVDLMIELKFRSATQSGGAKFTKAQQVHPAS